MAHEPQLAQAAYVCDMQQIGGSTTAVRAGSRPADQAGSKKQKKQIRQGAQSRPADRAGEGDQIGIWGEGKSILWHTC